jgi:hypothetical protein
MRSQRLRPGPAKTTECTAPMGAFKHSHTASGTSGQMATRSPFLPGLQHVPGLVHLRQSSVVRCASSPAPPPQERCLVAGGGHVAIGQLTLAFGRTPNQRVGTAPVRVCGKGAPARFLEAGPEGGDRRRRGRWSSGSGWPCCGTPPEKRAIQSGRASSPAGRAPASSDGASWRRRAVHLGAASGSVAGLKPGATGPYQQQVEKTCRAEGGGQAGSPTSSCWPAAVLLVLASAWCPSTAGTSAARR